MKKINNKLVAFYSLHFIPNLFYTLLFTLCTGIILAQNGVGINTTTPQAALEVVSTSSGILIPRMTSAQRVSISSPPVASLVYQTDGTTGFYYYNGSSWLPLLNNTTGWSTTGNTGTTAGTNFIGTTDAQDFVLKTNGTERMRFLSTGNIGIGTTAPTDKLNVEAAGDCGLRVYGTGASGRSLLVFASPGGAWQIENPAAGVGNVPAGALGFIESGIGARLTLLKGGNVGIGTTTPGQLLDVAANTNAAGVVNVRNASTGTGAYSGVHIGNSNTANRGGIAVFSTGYTETGLYKQDGTYIYNNSATGGVSINAEGASFVRLGTSNAERVRVDASGNVGIGTSGPSKLLHLSTTMPATGSGAAYTGTSDNTIVTRIDNNYSDACAGGGIDFTPLYIKSNLCGGGTNARNGIELVTGLNTGVRLLTGLEHNGTGASSFIVKNYSGGYNEVMRINSSGNMGIGTTTPLGRLHLYSTSGQLILEDSDEGGALRLERDGGGFNLELVSSNANLLRVSDNGNVGVGTATPSSLLHVNGAMRWGGGSSAPFVYSSLDGGGLYIEQVGTTTTNSKIRLQSSPSGSTSSYSQFFIDPTNGFSFMNNAGSNGNVGIGTSGPTAKLEVAGGKTNLDGVEYLSWSGSSAGNQTVTCTFTHGDQSSMEITAVFNHYGYISSYGAARKALVANFSIGTMDIVDILNVSSANGGTWSITRSGNQITITKSAGTYGGTGRYYVTVTGNGDFVKQ